MRGRDDVERVREDVIRAREDVVPRGPWGSGMVLMRSGTVCKG